MTRLRSFWNRRRRGLLLALPGLVVPVVLLGVCVRFLIPEAIWYHSLSPAARTGGVVDAGFGLFLLSIGIGASVLLCVPPLLIALPTRLQPWQCIIAMVLQAFGLLLAGATWGWLGVAVLVYVPALMVYRLVRARERVAEVHLTST